MGQVLKEGELSERKALFSSFVKEVGVSGKAVELEY
jgi:hypothetical protein